MKNIIMFASIALIANSATAQQESYEGDGLEEWVYEWDGETNRTEIFIDTHGTIATMDNFSMFDFTHTWAGALVIKLTHKDTGTSVTMLDRPGVPESNYGDSSDFDGYYQWQDGGFVYDADIYDGIVPTDVIMGPVNGALSDFAGEDKFGTWSLTIEDHDLAEIGSLAGWGLTVTIVPVPGAFALLGMAGLIDRRKRNRA